MIKEKKMNQEKIELEQNLLFDLLWTEKWITNEYNNCVNDSSTSRMKQQMMYLLSDQHQIYSQMFDEISKRGWIETKPADYEQIKTTKEKYLQQLNEL